MLFKFIKYKLKYFKKKEKNINKNLLLSFIE